MADGNAAWCIEKQRVIPDFVAKECFGTLRSKKCTEVTYLDNYMCFECRQIPNIPSLRLRVLRRANARETPVSTLTKVKNATLSSSDKAQKLKAYRKFQAKQRTKLLRTRKQLLRARGKVKALHAIASEHAERGDTAALSETFKLAYSKGVMSERTKTLGFINDIVRNIKRKAKGRRYSKFTKSLYEVARIYGGTRMVKFLSANLGGPSESTVKRSSTQKKGLGQCGFQIKNIEETKEMYKSLMEEHNIGSVIVEQAEDETVIIKSLQYDQTTDSIIGSCGPKGPDHKCLPNYTLAVGAGDNAYERIERFFENSTIPHMARVIMLNPVHVMLPSMVVYLSPTCNTFDHRDVISQWRIIQNMYNEHFLKVFNAPLVGKASDGDSRRRKAMMQSATSEVGERVKIDHPNFTLTCCIERTENGQVSSLNIMDQDYIHNGKKLTYPLDHATRRLSLGNHMAHMNHLVYLQSHIDQLFHGLRHEDVVREDRQNWASSQRLMFPRVQEQLHLIEQGVGGERPEDVKGTRMYLKVCHLYVEIFCSLDKTLLQRVVASSTVANFMRIWRWWIYRNPNLSLTTNFLTRQCYDDVLLSCHAAVLFIIAARDYMLDQPLPLAKTGSDCCEDLFSQFGSWVMNRHNYTFADMVRVLPEMNTLNQMRADPDEPDIPKGHKKQINIWDKGHNLPEHPPNMSAYPADDELAQAWEDGLHEAQEMCRELGMCPDPPADVNDPPDLGPDPPNDPPPPDPEQEEIWFFHPHILHVNDERLLQEAMADEDDDLNDEGGDSTETEIATELRHQLETGDEKSKHCPTVTVPNTNQQIHKSTLISMLNSNGGEKLSKDRLRRVQSAKTQQTQDCQNEIASNHRKEIGLYHDIAFTVRQANEISYKLGRVQRIIKQGRCKVEYKRPIDLDETKNDNINLHVILYEENANVYTYAVGQWKVLQVKDVIMGVELNYDEDGDKFSMDVEDRKELHNFIQVENNKRIHQKKKRGERSQAVSANNVGIDGRVVVDVEPIQNTSGNRRSDRRRKAIVHDS